MSRLIWLVCCIALFLSPYTLSAQRRGGHGAGAGRGSAGGAAGPDDLKDFKRALALQASPDQAAQFQRVIESTAAARKSAQDFVQIAENANKSDLVHDANPLTSAVEEAQSDNDQFLRSFSDVQKSELKDVTKKLGKANSDVTKQHKVLDKELGRARIDGKQIAGVVEKLDNELKDFQTEQLAIGKEMGIESQGKSQ